MENNRELMLKYGIVGRNLTIYSILFMYISGIMYISIMQYAMRLQINDDNQTSKVLIYPAYSNSIQKSPIYEIIYGIQCICGYVLDSVTSGACGLAALFVTHACGQIDVIISRLDEIVAEQFYKKNSNPNIRLIEIIKHHIKILK